MIRVSLILLLLLATLTVNRALASESVDAAVANSQRSAADRALDPNRKPAEVLDFLAIEPGMTVLDLFAGGGYYTQILDGVVGPQGQVLAHNNAAYMAYTGPELQARMDAGTLNNSRLIVAEAKDLDLADNSLDATMMVLAYHDFLYSDDAYGWPDIDETGLLAKLCRAMKPGAILGIIDHTGEAGTDPMTLASTLHRVDPQVVLKAVSDSCFDLAGTSDVLRNPADDLSSNALEGPLRGQTDRFIFRFVRR